MPTAADPAVTAPPAHSLRDLALVAQRMPWDTCDADVPFASRHAFRQAVSPDVFLEMIDALQMAQTYVNGEGTEAESEQIHAVIAKVIGVPS